MYKKIDIQKLSDNNYKILISDEENKQTVEINISGINIENIINFLSKYIKNKNPKTNKNSTLKKR
ncbi:MAG: hypothetical protein ACK4GJ_00520 [bacterium]